MQRIPAPPERNLKRQQTRRPDRPSGLLVFGHFRLSWVADAAGPDRRVTWCAFFLGGTSPHHVGMPGCRFRILYRHACPGSFRCGRAAITRSIVLPWHTACLHRPVNGDAEKRHHIVHGVPAHNVVPSLHPPRRTAPSARSNSRRDLTPPHGAPFPERTPEGRRQHTRHLRSQECYTAHVHRAGP